MSDRLLLLCPLQGGAVSYAAVVARAYGVRACVVTGELQRGKTWPGIITLASSYSLMASSMSNIRQYDLKDVLLTWSCDQAKNSGTGSTRSSSVYFIE